MARDVTLLEAVIAQRSPPVLRLYGWSRPTLSLGRNQGIDAADLGFCRTNGVEVVRRPTGGRAVLHQHELTYSIVAPLGRGPLPRVPQEAYTKICSGLVGACRSLGLDAALVGDDTAATPVPPTSAVPCFKGPAAGEVVVAGRKLIGSAMRSRHDVIVQHGAILLDWDGRLQAGCMGLRDDLMWRPFVTTFAEQLGTVPPREHIEQALVAGLGDGLGVRFENGALTPGETSDSRTRLADFTILD